MSKLIIHLIDDNEIDLAINAKLLEFAKIGDELYHYETAPAFLQKIVQETNYFTQYRNVVLLDIMMPTMNGFECVIEFNKLPTSLTDSFEVFMLSSSIDRHDIKNAEKTPRIIDVMEKPLDHYKLRRLLGL